MWKAGFTRFLDAAPERLHFAAHSHHAWPDVTFEAQQRVWLDAARLADDKWAHVFGEVLPEARRHVARELALPREDSVVFAPNTHELVLRLLSCLPERPRIVTSDSEFHSFERQTRRLEEEGLAQVTRVATEPFDSFGERLVAASAGADLVFFSHVFFNSGAVVQQLDALVASLPESAMVVIDGYHGFCAVPASLAGVASRAFYLAGGYKYAMAGEGACFLHVPDEALHLRPRNTGWFAAFGELDGKISGVPYAEGAQRFAGATFDVSGLYRFNAAMAWRTQAGCTADANHRHVQALQQQFLDGLPVAGLIEPLVRDAKARGNFLTFRTPAARELSAKLKALNIIADARDDRLRFGFGPYHDAHDVEALLRGLRTL